MNPYQGLKGFPEKIRSLERFSERFDAFKLAASGCDVLFATYPAGTESQLPRPIEGRGLRNN